MRWLYATVVDSSGIPVSGATVWSTLSPSSTTAQYPDNGLATTPTARTLWYLGRTASGTNAWNRTDSDGLARIPLFTDQITTATLPNAESFGNYHQQVTYAASSTSGDEFYDPYPAVSAADRAMGSEPPRMRGDTGRGRSVGSSSVTGKPASRSRHQEVRPSSTSPWSQLRCQTAKSGYWTGGAGRAGRLPVEKAR